MPRPCVPSSCTATCARPASSPAATIGSNALHELARWSFRGNACEIPTDCPQRERSGFTGDWQVFVDTAAMLYDVEAFSAKWLDDLAADQWPDGRVPTVIPNPAGDGPSGIAFEDMSAGSAGWGDAAVLVPWELWRHYGDLGALRRRIPSMRRWVGLRGPRGGRHPRHPDRMATRPDVASHEEFLWDTGFHFGEWLEPGVPPRPDPTADHSIVATAFLHRSATLLAAAARLVGDEDGAAWASRISRGRPRRVASGVRHHRRPAGDRVAGELHARAGVRASSTRRNARSRPSGSPS